MDDFRTTTTIEIADQVRAGSTSAREQTERALAVIDGRNDELGAFVAVDHQRALGEADEVDRRIAAGEDVGPLAGVPLGVKDLEDAAGYVTTFGSKLHVNDAPATGDSVLVERLRAAGCVVVGKTNTPEFGHRGDTTNEVFPATKNPYGDDRSAGGSSGGSAAAIASGMVPLATGSDGGGSIRIPCAVTGLSGLKPSRGRVPIRGEEASTWLHYTTPGPMAKRIAEVAHALDQVVGPDPTDLNSLPAPRGESWYDGIDEAGLPRAVLWSPDLGFGTTDTEIASVCRAAVDKIADAGVEVIAVDEVFDHDPVREWASVALVGLRAKMRAYEGTAEADKFSESLRALTGFVADADMFSVYDGIRAGHRLNYRLVQLFHRAPLLLSPTLAGHPGAPGADGTINGEQTPSWISYTPPFNMTGNPAGSLKAGMTADGMPVGLQVVGPQHGDMVVLRAMAAFESVLS